MHTASCQPRTVTQPHRGSEVIFVQRDLVVSFLQDFLTAYDEDDAAKRAVFTSYVRARAEMQLAAWGIAR